MVGLVEVVRVVRLLSNCRISVARSGFSSVEETYLRQYPKMMRSTVIRRMLVIALDGRESSGFGTLVMKGF